MYKVTHILLKKKLKGKLEKYFKINENGNTTIQNIWGTEKAVLKLGIVAHVCSSSCSGDRDKEDHEFKANQGKGHSKTLFHKAK
jgi:hypothetical protein